MGHQIKKHLGVIRRKNEAEFRLWAPNAKAVSISGTFTPHGPISLQSEDDGYWSVIIPDVQPGQDYQYAIDTGTTTLYKNDPRGLAVTASDKGFSLIIDNDFDWEADAFTPPPPERQIIYELHIGTFSRVDAATPGTFDTAIDRLDYLKDLGINMIELLPITSMAYSNGWGYAPNYIYSVEAMYGGRYGLMKFVREAHKRGIGVILDLVYNHFSSDTDLWQFDGWSENNRGGIYFYNDARGDTPWGGRPDYGRPEVRQFILDNVTMWLTDYRIDGLRVDSTIYMRNTEGHDNDSAHDIPDAWYLMQDITQLVKKINPHAITIAEDMSATAFITKPVAETGAGFDAQWELGFPHAVRDALGLTYGVAPNLAGLRYALERHYNGNAYEKIIFSDSHDTAANGSVRLNEAAAPADSDNIHAQQKTLLAAAVMLTAPGIPMLLQGSEFLQEGAFNAWQELQWKNIDKLQGIVEAHKHLIQLRLNSYGSTTGLTGQSTAVFHQDDANFVMGYHRWDQGGSHDDVVVIVNFCDRQFDNYVLRLPRPGTWHMRFNSSWKGYSKDFKEVQLDTIVTDDSNMATITLPPYGVYILSQE